MIRLSGAMTLFGIEQLGHAMVAPLDTQRAVIRLCNTLDGMSDTLVRKLDSANRATFERMTRAQSAVFNGALDVVRPNRADDFVRKTSQTLSDAMRRTETSKAADAA